MPNILFKTVPLHLFAFVENVLEPNLGGILKWIEIFDLPDSSKCNIFIHRSNESNRQQVI